MIINVSETLFKGRYRHSFREIDNTKLHNTCNLSCISPWKISYVCTCICGKGETVVLEGAWENRFCFRKIKIISTVRPCETWFNRNCRTAHAPEIKPINLLPIELSVWYYYIISLFESLVYDFQYCLLIHVDLYVNYT